jgi:acylpyruvate hydrolase
MRLASCERLGRRFAAFIQNDVALPILGMEELGPATPFDRVADLPTTGERLPLHSVSLRPVIPHPRRVICLGLNYRTHAAETHHNVTDYPALFCKFSSALIGPSDPIVKPAESDQLDYEAELAVIIGRKVRRASPSSALEAVAGYTIANDVTVRDYQYRTHQWLQGKTWDRTTPLGPWLVPTSELGDAKDLGITLDLNGRRLQSSNTSQLIFDVPTVISTLSEFTTLEPGDVILTGTPSGVGYRREPQIFLRDGDRVRVEIEEIGMIENQVVSEEHRSRATAALARAAQSNTR